MQILRMLYDYEQQKPRGSVGLERNDIMAVLYFMFSVPEKMMDFNMKYLEGKALVKLFKTIGVTPWHNASITHNGVDVIESKQHYSRAFPFLNINIQQIGNVYGGHIFQAIGSNVKTTQISDSFKIVYQAIQSKTDIPNGTKTQVLRHLDVLEEEVSRETPDVGRVQRAWAWLKRNANWVVPTLTQILFKYNITEVLKILK